MHAFIHPPVLMGVWHARQALEQLEAEDDKLRVQELKMNMTQAEFNYNQHLQALAAGGGGGVPMGTPMANPAGAKRKR